MKIVVVIVLLMAFRSPAQILYNDSTRRQHGQTVLTRVGTVACPSPLAGTYSGDASTMTDAATAYTDPASCYN